MKRRYYKIHHVDHSRPMKRVKHRHIIWSHVLLAALALVLVVVGVLAIIKWIGMGRAGRPSETVSEPSSIPVIPSGIFTPDPEASAETSAEPTASPSPVYEVSPIDSAMPSSFGFNTRIMYDGEEKPSYSGSISFGEPESYASAEGILTFAGDNWRTGFSYGSPQVTQKSFEKLWNIPVGSLYMSDYLGSGTGWTGQPIIVKWSSEVRAVLGVYDKFKADENFTEVIYPTMDGNIYFADLYTGEQTRQPLNIGVITKGTAALDPRGYPLLYTGQGISSTEDDHTGAWVRVIDLIQNKVVYKFGGKDPFSPRVWQAYDSSPLVSAEADTLIMPGENGVIYFVRLNTSFDPAAGTVSVSPDPLLKYKYSVENGYSSTDEEGLRWYGFESSCACFDHYLFVSDNGGRLQCVDMNTLELKYVLDVTDDSDVSAVLEKDEADGNIYLYTANEVDKQTSSESGRGTSWHRKFNAMTGELVWQNSHSASVGGSSSNGGTLATPHVGRGEISGLVIYSMTLAEVEYTGADGAQKSGFGGLMIAYDKHTGEEVWRYTQEFGYWASPAVVYAEDGTAYIVQADRDGMVSLHTAKDGKRLAAIDLGSRIESTPAVFNGYIVLGTRGSGGREQPAAIYCIKLG